MAQRYVRNVLPGKIKATPAVKLALGSWPPRRKTKAITFFGRGKVMVSFPQAIPSKQECTRFFLHLGIFVVVSCACFRILILVLRETY